MHDEYKYKMLKFSASYIKSDDNLKKCNDNIFQIQEIYLKSEYKDITFCPITFCAK